MIFIHCSRTLSESYGLPRFPVLLFLVLALFFRVVETVAFVIGLCWGLRIEIHSNSGLGFEVATKHDAPDIKESCDVFVTPWR